MPQHITQLAANSVPVVIAAPMLEVLAGVGKDVEPIGVQASRPKLAFDCGEGSWHGTRGRGRVALFDPDRLWLADLDAGSCQRLNHFLTTVGKRGAVQANGLHIWQKSDCIGLEVVMANDLPAPCIGQPERG